jgi:hypothetical protein
VTGVAVSVDRSTPAATTASATASARTRHHRARAPPDPSGSTSLHPDHGHQGEPPGAGRLVAWAAEQGAVAFNCYFLVRTGRATRLSDLDPEGTRRCWPSWSSTTGPYLGRMMVRAKCAPHFMRLLHRGAPDRPSSTTRPAAPAGLVLPHHARRQAHPSVPICRSRRAISGGSPSPMCGRALRVPGPSAPRLGGKCGRCEYRFPLRRLPRPGVRARRGLPRGGSLLRVRAGRRRRADPSRPSGDLRRPRRAHTHWTPDAEARLRRIPLVRPRRGGATAGGPRARAGRTEITVSCCARFGSGGLPRNAAVLR